MVINGPGEYEVRGVFITGVWSYADNKGGKERGDASNVGSELDNLISPVAVILMLLNPPARLAARIASRSVQSPLSQTPSS